MSVWKPLNSIIMIVMMIIMISKTIVTLIIVTAIIMMIDSIQVLMSVWHPSDSHITVYL